MDASKIVENIQRICKERGTNPTAAGKESGAGKDLVTNMKNRSVLPSIEKMMLLAEYLGVSTSELLGEAAAGRDQSHQESQAEAKKRAPPVSGEALEVAEAYDAADPYLQLSVRKLLDLDAQRNEIRIAARRSDGSRTSTGPDTDVEI